MTVEMSETTKKEGVICVLRMYFPLVDCHTDKVQRHKSKNDEESTSSSREMISLPFKVNEICLLVDLY